MRNRVREIAEQRGISQTELMYLSKTSPDTIHRYWHNEMGNTISIKVLKRFAEILGVKVIDLLEDEPEEVDINSR